MTNIVRATVQSLAAVLGGVQSLATSSWDEAISLPSEESVQLSLRTQQIIAYESGVCDSVDPLGGSYLVESLTNAVEEEAKAYIETIDGLGGAVAAIEQGFQQREIQESAYRYQQDIESGKLSVIGVNKFISPYPKLGGIIRVDPAVAQRQKERLASIKERRDSSRASAALRRLEEVARGSDNIMSALIDCVEAYATLGEMCDVLRGVFGEQKEFISF
jgi:methylmalonyl-CoA mutase N-terminal domain/subunit